jgi:hypothetical protein
MHEFNNRIEAQRSILKTINSRNWAAEELAGLSHNTIERWISANRIDPESRLVALVKECGAKLFFLANKSQDQISPEYEQAAGQLESVRHAIESELKRS